jgi:hypothetical protein
MDEKITSSSCEDGEASFLAGVALTGMHRRGCTAGAALPGLLWSCWAVAGATTRLLTIKYSDGNIRVPDLPSGEDNSWFGGVETQTIRLPINTARTPHRSTTSPQVINLAQPDWPRHEAYPLHANQEHKQGQGRIKLNCRNPWIKHSNVGFHKPINDNCSMTD